MVDSDAQKSRPKGRLQTLVKQKPGHPKALDLARLHMDQGRMGLARGVLEAFLEHDPNSLNALLLMATVYERVGELDAAQALILRAAKADPSDERPSRRLRRLAAGEPIPRDETKKNRLGRPVAGKRDTKQHLVESSTSSLDHVESGDPESSTSSVLIATDYRDEIDENDLSDALRRYPPSEGPSSEHSAETGNQGSVQTSKRKGAIHPSRPLTRTSSERRSVAVARSSGLNPEVSSETDEFEGARATENTEPIVENTPPGSVETVNSSSADETAEPVVAGIGQFRDREKTDPEAFVGVSVDPIPTDPALRDTELAWEGNTPVRTPRTGLKPPTPPGEPLQATAPVLHDDGEIPPTGPLTRDLRGEKAASLAPNIANSGPHTPVMQRHKPPAVPLKETRAKKSPPRAGTTPRVGGKLPVIRGGSEVDLLDIPLDPSDFVHPGEHELSAEKKHRNRVASPPPLPDKNGAPHVEHDPQGKSDQTPFQAFPESSALARSHVRRHEYTAGPSQSDFETDFRVSGTTFLSRPLHGRIILWTVAVIIVLTAGALGFAQKSHRQSLTRQVKIGREALRRNQYPQLVSSTRALQIHLSENSLWVEAGDGIIGLLGGQTLSSIRQLARGQLLRFYAQRFLTYGDQTVRSELASAFTPSARPDAGFDHMIAGALYRLGTKGPASSASWLEEAKPHFRKRAPYRWVRAMVYEAEGNHESALKTLSVGLATDNSFQPIARLYLKLEAKTGSVADVLSEYQLLLQSDETASVALRIQLEALRIKVKKRPEVAAANLKEILKNGVKQLAPVESAEIHLALGRYHADEGRMALAESAFRSSMERMPDDWRYARPLLNLFIDRFDLDGASELIKHLPAFDPHGIQGPSRAQLLLLEGRADAALKEVTREPNTMGYQRRFITGVAYLKKGIADSARGLDADASFKLSSAQFEALKRLDGRQRDFEIYFRLANALQKDAGSVHMEAIRDLRGRPLGRQEHLQDRGLAFRAYGEGLLARGQWRRAKREFENAIKISNGDFRAQDGLCRAEARRFKLASAMRACQEALANRHYQPARYRMAYLAEAGEDMGAVVTALKPFMGTHGWHSDAKRRLGRAFLALGQEDALKQFLAALESEGNKGEIAYVSALVHTMESRNDEALRSIDIAARELPGEADVLLTYGEFLMKAGRTEEASAHFRKVKAISPEPHAALAEANAALLHARWDKARRLAREAERRAGRSLSHPSLRADALALQALTSILSGKRSAVRKAPSLIRKALNLAPDLPRALLAQGLFAQSKGQTDDAIAFFSRLIEVAPDDAEGYFRLGKLLLDVNDRRDEGRQRLQRVRVIDPEGHWGERARRILARP